MSPHPVLSCPLLFCPFLSYPALSSTLVLSRCLASHYCAVHGCGGPARHITTMSFGAPVDVGTRPHVCRGMPGDAFVGAVYLVT